MKKTLLLLSSVVMSLGAFAQNFTASWPQPGAPEFTPFEVEQSLYMWNVGAGGFYINHQGGTSAPYYGTAASVNDTIGVPVKFTRTNPNEKIKDDFTEGTENSYLLVSYVTKFKENRCSFADGWVWTDNNENAYRFFDVTEKDGKISFAPNATLIAGAGQVIPETYVCNPIGVAANDAEKMVRISATGEEWFTEWAFVTEEVYTSYIENAKDQIKLYAAAEALRKTIEKAIADNPGLNLDEQVAVYNNTANTVEDLNAAKESIPAAIVAFTASKATIDNPVNYSTLITNPTFDKVGDFTGWSSGFGAGGVTGPSAECYGKAFNVYQTIKDLPTGVYMVKVNGYFRKENADNDLKMLQAGTPSEAKLYAKSGDINSSVAVKHVTEGRVETAFGANNENEIDVDGVKYYVPNTMAAADYYFHETDGSINPRYENTVYVPVSNGELTIGVENTVGGGSDWSIFDDFQLYYIGDGDASYDVLKDNLVSSLEYELAEGSYSKKHYDDYTNAYAALEAATGKNAIVEYSAAKAALDSLQESVKNYATYQHTYEDADNWLTKAVEDGINEDIEAVAMLADYLSAKSDETEFEFINGCYADIIDEKTNAGSLTNEQIKAEIDFLNELVKTAQTKGIYEGADLTSMLINPGFEEAGGKGWTNSYGALTNWHGGNADNYCAEAWNSNFDVYQDVANLENGLYEVSVQAFYRTAANGDAYNAYESDPEMKGDAKVLSYVYFNEFSTPIRNVMEIRYTENLANNCYAAPDGSFTLNGMTSASTAFSMEDEDMNFTMKVYGIVSDGKMRLGIRNTEGSIFDRWTLWDNFKLRYMGKNKVAVASVLKTKCDVLIETMNTDENINQNTKAYIDQNIEGAYALVGNIVEFNEKTVELLDKEELWNALVAVGNVQGEVDKDKEAFLAYKKAVEKLEELNADNFTQEMQQEYYAVTSDFDLDKMTREELLAAAERINNDLAWFSFPAKVEAAEVIDELPEVNEEGETDFTAIINNPSFEVDAVKESKTISGWNNAGTIEFQYQNNDAFAKTDPFFCERWHVDGFLNINQVKKDLPAGYYTLSADCYNETADGSLYILTEKLDENSKVVSNEVTTFIEKGDAMVQQNFSVTGYYDGEGIITFGYKGTLTSSTWMVIDNVTLSYSKDAPTSIDAINASAAKSETSIFTISGSRVNSLAKGINIVKMADGSVKKVLVK